jgi:branched-chain amino acid transport system permease protein
MNRASLLGYAALAAGIAIVWAIDIYAIPWTNPYYTNIAIRVGFNLLAVMGLALVLGFTGQFSLGHAGFMAVGAYSSASLALHANVPPMLAVPIGGFLAGAAGLLVGVPSLRLSGDYLAVVTLGFNQIIVVIVQNVPALGGALGLTGVPVATTFGITFTWVLLGAVFMRNLLNSSHGRAFAAVRDNEIATRSLGVDTTRVKVTAFVVGAFWAGIAGALLGFYNSSIFPLQFEFTRSIELLTMVVLGGTGSLSGPLLAAGVLTALPEALREFSQYRMVVYAALLITVMGLRPQGILGRHELSDVVMRLFRRRAAA